MTVLNDEELPIDDSQEAIKNGPKKKGLKHKEKLNNRQLLFVSEYLKDLNPRQAGIRAGYKGKEMGRYLMTVPHVRAAIQEAQAKIIKKNEITADKVLRAAAAMALSDIGRILKWDSKGRIKRVTPTEELDEMDSQSIQEFSSTHVNGEPNKRNIRVKLHPKKAGVDFLGAFFKMLIERDSLSQLLEGMTPEIAGPLSEALGKYMRGSNEPAS